MIKPIAGSSLELQPQLMVNSDDNRTGQTRSQESQMQILERATGRLMRTDQLSPVPQQQMGLGIEFDQYA